MTSNLKPLTTEQLKRIKSFPAYTGECPTCEGEQVYRLDGGTFSCDCQEQLQLQRRYFAANIGAAYHIISFNDFFDNYEYLRETVENYIANFDDNLYYGRGITFDGPLGTGKTYGATVILKELIKRGHDGFFITFDDLLNVQSKGWKQDEYDPEFYTIRNTELLVVDELFDHPDGTKKKELLSETLERIIRYRVSNRLPTILTTNLKPDQEALAYPRVNSLLSTCQIRCSLYGDDLRKGKVRQLTDNRIARGDRKPIV